MAFIANLQELQDPTLRNVNFTDDGLSHLESLTNLHTLTITECKAVTGAGLRHLFARRGSMSKFLSKPNLGGQLTIANCLLWLLLLVWEHYFYDYFNETLGNIHFAIYTFISIPLAFFCMLPHVGGGPSEIEVFIDAIVVGLNSMVWGYSLAWFINGLRLEASQGAAAVPTDDDSTNNPN